MEYFNFIASLASIVGAIIAWLHATNARKFSDQAREQVAAHRQTSDLSRLEEKGERACEAMRIFGPASSKSDLRGKSPSEAAQEVQSYIESVIALKASLLAISDLDNRQKKLIELLERFSEAKSAEDMKNHGTILLNALWDLKAAIHTAQNVARENVQLKS